MGKNPGRANGCNNMLPALRGVAFYIKLRKNFYLSRDYLEIKRLKLNKEMVMITTVMVANESKSL